MAVSRTPADSDTTLTLVILHEQLDPETGLADPAALMHLADDTAYIAAMRHSLARRCSTACVSDFKFTGTAQSKDLVTCTGRVMAVGKKSMLVEITLSASSPPFTESRGIASGDFVYALVEAEYTPLEVPRLVPGSPVPDSDEDQRVMAAAAQRLSAIKTTATAPGL